MANWSIPIAEIARRQKQRIEDVVNATTLTLFSRVIVRSPVDSGRFRANWNVSYGAPDASVTAAEDRSSGAQTSISNVKSALLKLKVGGIIYLCNSLPYAAALEFGLYPNPPKFGSKKRGEDGMAIHVIGGYSMQAPAGMVRVTAVEFADAVRDSLGAPS